MAATAEKITALPTRYEPLVRVLGDKAKTTFVSCKDDLDKAKRLVAATESAGQGKFCFIQAASVEGHGCPCGAQVLYLLIGVRKATANFEAVRVLAHELPDLQESTMYGLPALKLGKRLVACVAIHRSAEPGSLVVRTDFEQRAALLADDPGTFYVTDHYVSHPVVLVRMSRLQQDQLRELLAAARQCVLTHADQKKARRREQDGYDR